MKLPKILLVDDEINIINSYRRTLRNIFDLDFALGGEEALKLLSADKKYAVIVTDMKMPNMNGLELLEKAKELVPDTVRIMLTGNSEQDTAVNAVNIGDIFRFINKPCDSDTLINNINLAVKQHNLIVSERLLLNRTLKGVINVLSDVLALVNPDATDNSTKILDYMQRLAKVMKLPHTWGFEPMVKLSQLGCVIFPQDTIKNMDNGPDISPEEKQLLVQHPCLASDLIMRIPRMENIARSILYQEKCFNGEGVPMDDVKGKKIPLGSRMLKVVIDFIRFEKQGLTKEQAFSKLTKQSQFYDPEILLALKKSLELIVELPKKIIQLADLKENMIINGNLLTIRGQLVAKKGQKVTETLLHIISHCLENNAISGAVEVIDGGA
ncbi:MAG: response regulator [Paraglaciecola sp.]|nr:response regulator [Paraglaciecola sp.]